MGAHHEDRGNPRPPIGREDAKNEIRWDLNPRESQVQANATRKAAEARRKGRGIVLGTSPLTGDPDYSRDETDLLAAVDRYKRMSGRMFPTICEVLALARQIGFVRANQGEVVAGYRGPTSLAA